MSKIKDLDHLFATGEKETVIEYLLSTGDEIDNLKEIIRKTEDQIQSLKVHLEVSYLEAITNNKGEIIKLLSNGDSIDGKKIRKYFPVKYIDFLVQDQLPSMPTLDEVTRCV